MKTLQQWNSASNLYNQNMGEEGDYMNKEMIKPVILSMMGDYAKKMILDSGCGSGYFTTEWQKKQKE